MPPTKTVKPTVQETGELLTWAIARLGEGADTFRETGVLPSHMLGSEQSGPTTPQTGYTRQIVWLERPHPEDWQRKLDYHAYWSRVGYKNRSNAAYAEAAPPNPYDRFDPKRPHGRSVFAAIRWADVHRHMLQRQGAVVAGQMSLL